MNSCIIFLLPANHAFEVIKAAKNNGYYVLVVMNEKISVHPPYDTALTCIDKIVDIKNATTMMEWLSIIEKNIADREVAGVYHGTADSMSVFAAWLRKKFNILGNSIETMQLVSNKYQIRKKLVDAGLSSLKCALPQEFRQWRNWPFRKNAYFKPIQGSVSLFVEKCGALEELHAVDQHWQETISKLQCNTSADPSKLYQYISESGNDGCVLEEEIEGELLSVEAINFAGKFYPLGLLSRILFSENPIVELGSCFPYPHPLAKQIIEHVKRAHEVLDFKYGATHTELIVDAVNNRIEIIDFNPRFVGADVIMSINYAYQTAIQNVLLDLAMGKKPQLDFLHNQAGYACLQYILAPEHLEILESLNLPVNEHVIFKKQSTSNGTKLTRKNTQLDYLGAYLTVGNSFSEAIQNSHELRTQVLVNKRYPGRF